MIEYRLAEPSDAEAVAQLHTRSWREHYRGEFSDEFLDTDLLAERRRVWHEALVRPPENQFVQVAIDSANLVGFVCAYGAHDPEWGSFVDNIHVAPEAMKRGIGSSLMRQTGAWLAPRYPDLAVYLLVLESNAEAREFYERLGGRSARVITMETHGGAMVRSCWYTWPRAETLAAA